MERAQISFDSRTQSGLLDAFPELKQVWMTGANANPNDLGCALARKRSQASDRKEKRFPGDLREVFPQPFFNPGGDVAEKAQGQVHLAGSEPSDSGQLRV